MPRRSLWLGLAEVVGVYAVAAALATAVASLFLDAALPPADPCLLAGLGIAVALHLALRAGIPERRFWQLLWLALGALALINLFTRSVSIYQFGDAVYLSRSLPRGEVLGRWLAGHAVLVRLYDAAERLLPGVDPQLLSVQLVRVLSTVTMVAGSVLLHRRWPGRLTILLPTLTPVWWLFSLGYVEYYPLVAAVLVAALAWAMERPLEERPAWQVGAVAALLFPLLYLGYALVAAALIAVLLAARPRRGALAAGTGAAVAAAGVLLFWPGRLLDFGRMLIAQKDLGGGAMVSFYRPHKATPDSSFFALDYALSADHLQHLAFMWSFGGGALLPLLLVGGAAAAGWKWRRAVGGLLASSRFRLGALLAAGHLLYVLFMIPRMGPRRDVDLFFNAYLVAAFLAGAMLDTALAGSGARGERIRRLLVVALIGAGAVGGGLLAIHGFLRGPQGWFSEGLWH